MQIIIIVIRGARRLASWYCPGVALSRKESASQAEGLLWSFQSNSSEKAKDGLARD